MQSARVFQRLVATVVCLVALFWGVSEKALGASSDELKANPQTHYYITESSLQFQSALGTPWVATHYLGEMAIKVGELVLAYYYHHPDVAMAILAHEPLSYLPTVKAQSMLHLELVDRLKIQEDAYEISQIHGVKSILAIKTSRSNYDRFGIAAVSKNNRVVFLIETEGDSSSLPSNTVLGPLEEVKDLEHTRVSFRLTVPDRSSTTKWEPTLKDLLEKESIPNEVGTQWRQTFLDYRAKVKAERSMNLKDRLLEHIGPHAYDGLEVSAYLTSPESEKYLGTLAEGPAAAKVIGVDLLGTAEALVRKKSGAPPRKPKIEVLEYQNRASSKLTEVLHCTRKGLLKVLSAQ